MPNLGTHSLPEIRRWLLAHCSWRSCISCNNWCEWICCIWLDSSGVRWGWLSFDLDKLGTCVVEWVILILILIVRLSMHGRRLEAHPKSPTTPDIGFSSIWFICACPPFLSIFFSISSFHSVLGLISHKICHLLSSHQIPDNELIRNWSPLIPTSLSVSHFQYFWPVLSYFNITLASLLCDIYFGPAGKQLMWE